MSQSNAASFVRRGGALALVAWAGFVLREYVKTQTLVPTLHLFTGEVAIPVLGCAVLMATGMALGLFLLRWFPIEDALLRSAVAIAFGLGTIAEFTFVVGQVHLAVAPVLAVVGLISWVLGGRAFYTEMKQHAARWEWSKLLVAAMAFGGILAISASCPAWQWDELSYHLPRALDVAETGTYHLMLDDQSFQPELHETMTAIGMMFGVSAVIGRLLHLAFGGVLLVVVYVVSRRFTPDLWWAPALSVAVLFTDPVFFTTGTWANHDLVLTTYTVLAVFFATTPELTPRALLLGGIMGGFAASVSYRGLYSGAGLLAAILVYRRTKNVGLVLGGALLACAPWYLRNLFACGNPFVPFLGRIFHVWSNVPSQFSAYHWPITEIKTQNLTGFGAGRTLKELLATPWDFTINAHYGVWPWDGAVSPLYLMWVPMCFLATRRAFTLPVVAWGAFCVVHSVAWLWGLENVRYQFSVMAAIAILTPYFVRHSEIAPLRWVFLVMSTGVTAVLGIGAALTVVSDTDFSYFTGRLTSEEFLLRKHDGPLFRNVMELNREKERTPVFMLAEKRSFYLDRPAIIDINWWNLPLLFQNGGTPDGMYQLLKKDNMNDILVHTSGLLRVVTPEDRPALNAFVEMIKLHAKIHRQDDYLIWYKLN